ncbi:MULTISPECIES: hypothetical protein [Cupriavidus]
MSKKYRHEYKLVQAKLIPTIDLEEYRDEIKSSILAELRFPSPFQDKYKVGIRVYPGRYEID